jgi:hypothetical protein
MSPLLEDYRKFLRAAKAKGLTVEDAPPRIQQAWLAVHQYAQMAWWEDKKRKCSVEARTLDKHPSEDRIMTGPEREIKTRKEDMEKITATTLAAKYKVTPQTMRRFLRDTFPKKNDEYRRYEWEKGDKQLAAIDAKFKEWQNADKENAKKKLADLKGKKASAKTKTPKAKKAKKNEDEALEEVA